MKQLCAALVASALIWADTACAKTIVRMPAPTTRLFAVVPPEHLGNLKVLLLDFAVQEHLRQFKEYARRAKGKQFFLSLYSDDYSFVAERSFGSRAVLIECLDLDASSSRAMAEAYHTSYNTESPFGRIVGRLRARLEILSKAVSEKR